MVLILLKKLIALLVSIIIILSMQVCALAETEVSAHSAVLMCADTGEILYEKNPDEHMLIASTTKMMTAIIAIENCAMDEAVKIDTEWCCIEGSSMYLEAGKEYTVKELLSGMMLTSGNDAAMALACYISGSAAEFAVLMNEKAGELGMTESSFENPHGLDGEKQYSTARDMAVLAKYCMENDMFKEIVSMKSVTIGELTFINHNKLLWNCRGCIGVKTGYTIAAGRTLVSCCERSGMRLICVTLNAPEDWDDHMALYDWGFSAYSLTNLKSGSFSAEIPTVSGINSCARVSVENDILLLTKNTSKVNVTAELPRFLFAGGFAGEKAGKICVYVDGELAAEENLVYTMDNPVDDDSKLSLFERLLNKEQKPYYIEGSE